MILHFSLSPEEAQRTSFQNDVVLKYIAGRAVICHWTSTAHIFLVSSPARTHGHIFACCKTTSFSKRGLLFSKNRGNTHLLPYFSNTSIKDNDKNTR
jgi:hypothetical protein